MPDNSAHDSLETRAQRREQKLKKQREKMLQHGKGLAKMYRNVVLKGLKKK